MGKNTVSFEQSDDGVTIRCSDNTVHQGDILVEADGAYSAVWRRLFENLQRTKSLPASDEFPIPFSTVCLVGQTEVLDPEEFLT